MRLQDILCEAIEPTFLYHGTDVSNISTIMQRGLLPMTEKDYRATEQNVAANTEGAIFLTANPKIALKYADSLIQVRFNKKTTQIGHDTEWLIWNNGRGLPDPSRAGYEKYFASIEKKIERKLTELERARLRKTYETMQGTMPAQQIGSCKEILTQYRRILYNTSFDKWDAKTLRGNLMYSQPIGFRGNNRIIGIGIFELDDEVATCTSVPYNNGGTIKIGSKIKLATTFHGS